MICAVLPDGIRIRLRYTGTAVDDGTMPVSDVLEALAGFSGAYAKIASRQGADIRHELRLSAIETASFGLIVCAWVALTGAAGSIQTVETLTRAAREVFSRVAAAIAFKKHVRREPYAVNVNGNDNTVTVINFGGEPLSIPPDVLEILKEKLIDSDLAKIAAPLNGAEVNSVQLRAEDGGAPAEEIIRSDERELFSLQNVTTSQETQVRGALVSLNKENNRGTFRLDSGDRIRYHYVGEDPQQFHSDFAPRGFVRATGIVSFDESLRPISMEIKTVQRLQGNLYEPSPDSGDDPS